MRGFSPPAHKGGISNLTLCGFSPLFRHGCLLAHGYTLLTSVAVPQSSVPPILARAETTLIRTTQITICRCTRIYTFRCAA